MKKRELYKIIIDGKELFSGLTQMEYGDRMEDYALEWAEKINGKSPTANRMAKFALNLIDDGLIGQQIFAGEATRLAYMTDEAQEGRDAFLEKRNPDWSSYPYHF